MDFERMMLGFALMLLGFALISVSKISNVSYGAIVMVGPLPILVASEIAVATFLILITVALLIIATLLRWWR